MTISIWRYSHLALAVSSFLFIVLASVTGIILAFEPIVQQTQPYQTANFNDVTLAQTITALQKTQTELIDFTIDPNEFLIVKAIDTSGQDVEIYANASTGQTLGIVPKKNAFFEWITTLHRSLFLHEPGRIFIGITAFLLFLIAVSGTALLIQRQRGFRRFFTKIVNESFAQYYHIVLGRFSLIPILIITITGTYLSLVTLKILPEQKISHDIDFDKITTTPKLQPADFPVFKNTKLSEVQNIEFPFSDDPEDYYTLKLSDKELIVNQFTGAVLSEKLYSKTRSFKDLSLTLHTGRSSILWSIVLALAAANILFFVYSGFAMTLKRRKSRIKNKFKSDDCTIVILVGSENGSTFGFATALQQELVKNGQKVFLTQLNDYKAFPKAEHFVVLTATYGLGEAPTNAIRFPELLARFPQQQKVQFAVVGFGSHAYPDFCQFAFEVNNALSVQSWAIPLLEIHTVNDKSPEEFSQWLSLWSQKTNQSISVLPDFLTVKPKALQKMTVVQKTTVVQEEGAFLIRIKPKSAKKFTSGDLLAIYPANDHRERLYSIGKINSEVQLSVRLHENGLGSQFLNQLQSGEILKARLVANKHFHFPGQAKKVIMISNGTGIAPFLGMIDQNIYKTEIDLYCGFRGQASFDLYENALQKNSIDKKLTTLQVSFSREGKKQYVKDLLQRDAIKVAETLKHNGFIMICGSLSMQQNVVDLLDQICQMHNQKNISFYQSRGQLLMDCY